MECLLSIIEFNQYQQYLLNHENDKIDSNTLNKVLLFDFPSNIPISEIIEEKYDDNQDIKMYKMKAHKLYLKYIRVGSEYEINISGVQRDEIANLLDNLNHLLSNNKITPNALFILFEQCKQEMFQLLQSSLHRFRYEDEFNQIMYQLNSSSNQP